jgi:outer membrane protein
MSTFKSSKWWISLVVLFFGSKSFSQDTLTVEQAIATALHNNYDILLSKEDSASIAITNRYRDAVFLPTLNANSTLLFNRNNQSTKLSNGTETSRKGIHASNLNAALSLNWVLFDGLRMFIARDLIDVNIIRGNLTIKNQVVNTVADVIKTYYDIIQQRQQLRNVEELMALSADRLKLAQYKLDIGVGIKPDLLQAQIDYNNQKALRVNQLALIDQRKQDLNRLMNIPQTVHYEVSATISVNNDLVLGNLLNNIDQVSPALELSRIDVDIADVNVRMAKAARYPTIALTSAYNFTRNSSNSVTNPTFQPLFTLNRGFNYGLTASIPIFNRFTIKQQVKQAELSVDYSKIRYENQQSIINTGILNNFRSYVAQREIVAINDSSVILARENLVIERERYRLGATTFIELRQAEENLAQALSRSITTLYSLKVAETELLRLRGDLVK